MGGGQTSSGRTAVGAVGHWELALRPFSSPIPPPTPHLPPPSMSPARARADTGCQTLHHPRPPSSPPSPHYPPRARMTHSPPPRCLVTQSHFRVRDNVDSRARGRDGGGATGLLSGGCEGEAEPVPACRFLIGRLLDPAPQEEGPDSIKDTCSPLQRSLS